MPATHSPNIAQHALRWPHPSRRRRRRHRRRHRRRPPCSNFATVFLGFSLFVSSSARVGRRRRQWSQSVFWCSSCSPPSGPHPLLSLSRSLALSIALSWAFNHFAHTDMLPQKRRAEEDGDSLSSPAKHSQAVAAAASTTAAADKPMAPFGEQSNCQSCPLRSWSRLTGFACHGQTSKAAAS
jgi:hypothetical protein